MFAKWVLHKVYDTPNSNYKALSFGKKLTAAMLLGSVVGMKYGYEIAQKEDREKYLVKYEGEDWLSERVKQSEKPIFMVYYTPGNRTYLLFRRFFLEAAEEHHNECDFVVVNCAKHYHEVKNLTFDRIPKIDLILPKKKFFNEETQEFEMRNSIVQFNKNFSVYGITQFLKQNNAIENRTAADGLIHLYSDLISTLI